MSGGSYEHLYWKMEDAGRRLTGKDQPAYRRAFGQLLIKCAHAMYEVEWVDSDDKSPGDDEQAIMGCINARDVLACTVEFAEQVNKELMSLIKAAKSVQ